jgi:hypothetical protein
MNADSVKAKLKHFAASSGCTFQEALVYYGLERTIYALLKLTGPSFKLYLEILYLSCFPLLQRKQDQQL